MSIKCKDVEIITVYLDVEPVPFNKGFYSVDLTFFFKVTVSAYTSPVAPPANVVGIAAFSKKVILYGSDGNVKVYNSPTRAAASTTTTPTCPRRASMWSTRCASTASWSSAAAAVRLSPA